MSDTTATPEELSKALQALSDLAKSKGSTVTTRDPAMDSKTPDTHVFPSKGDSDPGSWAGSSWSAVPSNGATDSIEDNGTDLKSAAKMRKSILDKISKGQPVTAAEFEIVKGAMFPSDDKEDVEKGKAKKAGDLLPPGAGAAPGMAPDEDEKKKEEMAMMGKSLREHAATDPRVRAGFEVSDFLVGVVDVLNKSLHGTEARMQAQVSAQAARQEEFNKSLAQAVNNLAQVLGLTAQRVAQVEDTPAGPPRSIAKSGPAPQGGGQQLTKSQVLNVMCDLVKSNSLDPKEVVLFETTGQIRPEVAAKVGTALKG